MNITKTQVDDLNAIVTVAITKYFLVRKKKKVKEIKQKLTSFSLYEIFYDLRFTNIRLKTMPIIFLKS
jgi:hypothetical protein